MTNVLESVKELEEELFSLYNKDSIVAQCLMIENAANNLLDVIKQKEKKLDKKFNHITLLCGSSNNGADGYALCRKLLSDYKITVIQVKEPKSPFCIEFFNCISSAEISKIANINLYKLKSKVDSKLKDKIESSDVIVDCIFGTGFNSENEIPENIQDLFKVVNHTSCFKLACDVPSGLSVTGENLSKFTPQQKKRNVFFADATVTMNAYKLALFADCAKDVTGKIICKTTGVSQSLIDDVIERVYKKIKIYLLDSKDAILPIRNELNTNKGSYGHVCVIAGDKMGASILSASSAFKIGAGLVSIKVEENFVDKINCFMIPPRLMITDKIDNKVNTLVIGPGFGRENNIAQYLEIINERNLSCVFDADAFYYKELIDFLDMASGTSVDSENAVDNSTDKSKLAKSRHSKSQSFVLTPHPKEFCNLLKLAGLGDYSVEEVLANKIELARSFCNKYKNVVLVLKGANTFICKKNNFYICNLGSVALAKGGTGDVLTGCIAGLLAQGYSAIDASITGVIMHSVASKKFDKNYNLTPEELVNCL